MRSSLVFSLAVLAAAPRASADERLDSGDEEVIEDPLASKPVEKTPPKVVVAPPSPVSSPELRLDVWHRTTVDTRWARDPVAPALGEDVVRSWLRTTLGVAGGGPGRLSYRLDVRLDVEARAKRSASGLPLERPTWLYDAFPLAAFVEAPVGGRARVRVGEQIVAWGRMDLASAADVLDRRDLRVGPTVDPSWTRLPIPAVRIDVHPCTCLDLSVAWSVFSRPHRFELAGSSWALIGPGVLGTVPGRDTLGRLAAATDASTFVRVQDAFVQASSAPPRFDGGDLATRATLHAGGADVGLTYGLARTKLPVVTLDPTLVDLVTVGDLPSAVAFAAALDEGRSLITSSYPRYHQLALDLETTVGPLVASAEIGFSPSRPLYVQDARGLPVRADSGLAQGGVRLQYTRGEELAIVVEGDVFVATTRPDGTAPYVLLGPDRRMYAALASVREVIARRHVLELSGVFTSSGPSLFVSPRYGFEVDDAWTIGLGASFFPRLRDPEPTRDGITLADVQVGRDFVEAFVRFRR